ncbi:hypothetical protein FBZ89_114126 [Nitrospirillum amazonense]|uniref:Uncharacterized protein n=1 Tax=Nitrospirillum amazonense TaxID=28077 RepID=A0A560F1N3_9PROT|nr:hypothetical protein [Nitrospirillum amazonense]TWB15532.1 hypothetical protein FBZ89_114126 [Nitrospirillum amazonense]
MARKKTDKAALRKQRTAQLVRLHRLCVLIEKNWDGFRIFKLEIETFDAEKMSCLVLAMSNLLELCLDAMASPEYSPSEGENKSLADFMDGTEIMTQPLISFCNLYKSKYLLYTKKDESVRTYAINFLKFVNQFQEWVRSAETYSPYLKVLASSGKVEREVVANMSVVRSGLDVIAVRVTNAFHTPATVFSKDELLKWSDEAEWLVHMFACGVAYKLRQMPETSDAPAEVPPPPTAEPVAQLNEPAAKSSGAPEQAVVLH